MFACVAREPNKQKEPLLKKAMTTKYPSMLVLMETAEELSQKNCELQLQWIRRDLNQLADDPHQRGIPFLRPRLEDSPQGGGVPLEDVGPATPALR